jgi:hypothetical protein
VASSFFFFSISVVSVIVTCKQKQNQTNTINFFFFTDLHRSSLFLHIRLLVLLPQVEEEVVEGVGLSGRQ